MPHVPRLTTCSEASADRLSSNHHGCSGTLGDDATRLNGVSDDRRGNIVSETGRKQTVADSWLRRTEDWALDPALDEISL